MVSYNISLDMVRQMTQNIAFKEKLLFYFVVCAYNGTIKTVTWVFIAV